MGKKLALAWFDVFQTKDVHQLEKLLAEDFVHSSPFGKISSRSAYMKIVNANPEAFFSPAIEIVDVLDCGNTVVVRYLINSNPACDCIYVHNGHIVEIASYYHYGDKPTM